MPFKFFVVPMLSAETAERELNGFLAQRRVVSVERRLVQHGESWFWTFCVDYLDGAAAAPLPTSTRPTGAKAKVDYREVLQPDEFAVYVRLRELRKQIAGSDAVPVPAGRRLSGAARRRADNRSEAGWAWPA